MYVYIYVGMYLLISDLGNVYFPKSYPALAPLAVCTYLPTYLRSLTKNASKLLLLVMSDNSTLHSNTAVKRLATEAAFSFL